MSTPGSSKQFQLLYELGSAFASQLDLEELIPTIMTRCRDAFEAEGAAVLLLDPATNELFFPYVAEQDLDVTERLLGLRFPASEGIAGAVISSGKPELVVDVASDPRWYDRIDDSTGATTRNLLAVPLMSRDGPIGVVEVVNREGEGSFTTQDLALLEALAGSISVAIDNARLFAEIREREARLRSEVGLLRRDRARRDRFSEIVGTSAAMTEVFRLMDSAAASPISVLIEGETGTGKELVARGIHRASARADEPFVAVNCAALPADLLESELFGHRRGSFTGATTDYRGLFDASHHGTIFLDEVGELPLSMQVKLLRVLQDGEITPVGSTQSRKVDIRVVSATNRDLRASVGQRTFREDLYYRLAAFPIRVPPLRERDGDVTLLADHFLAAAAERHSKRIAGIEAEAFRLLEGSAWPGNVRQLENEIERAAALAVDGGTIDRSLLSIREAGGAEAAAVVGVVAPSAISGTDGEPAPLRQARAAFEAGYIREVLARNSGNVSHTARALGLSRVMLQKKMKEYGLRTN